jgi:hypothetical protein
VTHALDASDKLFDDKNWVFKTKCDGFPLIAKKRCDVVVARAALTQPRGMQECSCALDGELRALDARVAHNSGSCKTPSTKKQD